MSRPLHTLLDELLKQVPVSEIRKLVDKSDGWVSQIRHGKIIPRDEQLAVLAAQYAPARMGELLVAAAEARLRAETFGSVDLHSVAVGAWEKAINHAAQGKQRQAAKGRTLRNFPEAFDDLAVISGDKREDSESRINAGDFGAVSASPAESRWIFKLGLKRDVEFYTDKVFVLESEAQLKERFGRKNLLVIGSPGSNHFARRCHLATPPAGWRPAAPIFRFNILQQRLMDIEAFLDSLQDLSPKELVGAKAKAETERRLKFWLKSLFSGGIVDPTYKDLWLRGLDLWGADFGLVTLARNPFAVSDDYVCILVAGFHLFGTAHAVEMLAKADSPEAPFEKHPLGGVIKVNIDDQLPFARKFDQSRAVWDVDSDYTLEDMAKGLHDMSKKPPPGVHVSSEELTESLQFVQFLQAQE